MTLPKMDSRIGLDYIVENREYVSKLGAALDTNNIIVKKQVFELLSALCAYNTEGYAKAIETLEHYKNLKTERYRFKVVIRELENAATVEYQVALLAFINCVIISAPSLPDRLRIRNEFIGLGVLPILNKLRRESQSIGDIIVQLDVFDEQQECDEAQSLQGPNGINLNSHLDVFYAILGQVADTPQEIPFLNILQHLLRIDPKENISDIIWDTAEKLVHRATLLENNEDSVRLLRAPSIPKFSCTHCRTDATSPSRKQSVVPQTPTSLHFQPLSTLSNITSPTATAAPPLPPPPPPPAAPPPPPPPLGMSIGNGGPCAPPAPPPPAPPNLLSAAVSRLESSNRPRTPDLSSLERLLPQQETPAPKTKMKTINWNKIPQQKVLGKRNIWAIVADSHQHSPMADLDWTEMEGLFCLQPSNSTQGSPKLGRDGGSDTLDRKVKKENSEITLLDGKRSLNVNIFLKQFRSSNEDIIQLIHDGEHDDIGAEKLRGLLKILPEVDELDRLRSFDGDKTRLGNAEKFLLQLLRVPNYKLRIESMLLKEEFEANKSYLEPCISSMLFAGEDLMNNKQLQDVLYMVVVAGNFLNAGGYAGNAAGVKLSSLQKLTDIRANKPGMNLIHYVALQAEKRNPDLLTFPSQLNTLESASKTTSEQINNEINTLDGRIKKIKKQIELDSTENDIKEQMTEFLQRAEQEVSILQRGMKDVELLRVKIAEFFCEDPGTFRFEECFKIFHNFCERFNQAVKENERRRAQEEQANIRKKQREEQLARRAKQINQCGTPVSDTESNMFLDTSTFDVRGSPALSRRRMGSFNSNGDLVMTRDEGFSPDITPNGSLRHRRSRMLAEDDEGGLMEFLRTSGHDNGSRERKTSTYGSLDRSWARSARSGSTGRKRPDLLSVDFGETRERPSSPSPLAEVKPIVAEEPKPRITREWRQKIESWLQANENDEKQNEDFKRRRRLATNKRSLENDSESEKSKLDPLPEEKPTIGTLDSYKRVYPDWKPSATIEKTDIVSNIEAIEDAQSYAKDKSSLRKSQLNASSSNEPTLKDTSRYLSRQLSRDSSSSTVGPLHSIEEEDKRKIIIQQLGETPTSEKLRIYRRRPSELAGDDEVTPQTANKPAGNSHQKPTSPLTASMSSSSNSVYDSRISDRPNSNVEIDSDNIETPPVVRKTLASPLVRKLQAPRPLHPETILSNLKKESDQVERAENLENLKQTEELGGGGTFDRFSAARRTRRYKRPTDYSSGNEEIVPSSNETSLESEEVISSVQPIEKLKENIPDDKQEDRLKRWQEKLQSKGTTNVKHASKLDKIGRHISSINQEDVREAIRNLKSPIETPDRIWSPPREIIKEKPIKGSNHELNDEGFEETQSLVSDTPSHGKDSTSSCNENVANAGTKRIKAMRMTSSESAGTTSSDASKTRTATPKPPLSQNLLERNKRSLERSRSMRSALEPKTPPTVVARRTNSLRKSDPPNNRVTSPSKRDVERSSSRTSLRSSRSSLNSSVSTSTVRKVALKPHIPPSSPRMSPSPSKRPLGTQNTSTAKSSSRVPASRSSSSGSSIGPSVRKPPLKSASLGSTSFKENQSTSRSSGRNSALSSSRSNVSSPSSASSAVQPSSRLNKLVANTSRLSGFMRPTASSATKRQPNEQRNGPK